MNVRQLKLLLPFLMFGCMSLAQNINAQHYPKGNLPIKEALKRVSKSYGVQFVYDKQEVEGRYTDYDLSGVSKNTLEDVLKGVLYPNELVFLYVKSNYYTIVPKSRINEEQAGNPAESTEGGGEAREITPYVSAAKAQQVVKGQVTDAEGNGLVEVTVTAKGGRKPVSTTTNTSGNYTLTVPEGATQLVFSAVGYQEQTVSIGGRETINVTLSIDVKDLENVTVAVNTGYQVLSKERATGSYNVIGQEQLDKPATNIASRLIGTTAGMQARSLDADGNPVFEIRGLTSLNPDNASPLVVVDGFPIQGEFNSINPNDVESVTILKDAAAASIWGARSANGVIVVTTRKARKGVPLRVEFSTFTRFGKKLDLDYVRPLASSAETVAYEKMAFNKWSAQINSGALTNYSKQWSAATVAMSEHDLGFITEAERDAVLARLATQDNRAQISKHLLSNPVNKQYNLSLFGSSERMMNALSLMYEDNQSNFKETDNKRYMLNYRTSSDLFRWVSFNFSGMLQHNQYNNNGVSLGDIQGMSPYEMLMNPDGSMTNIHRYYMPIMEREVPMDLFPYADWTYNPIQEIANRDLKVKQLNARLQAGLTFKLLKGLSFDSKIQYELFNTNTRNLYNENTFNVRSKVNIASTWDQATDKITLNLPKGSILDQSRSQVQAYNFRNQLNFNRTFAGKHEISFVGGSEINNEVVETNGHPTTYGYNDNTLTVGTFPNGPGGTFLVLKNWMGSNQTFGYTNSFSYRTERYFSVFGNAAYTFNRKYTLSGSYRTDASNLITDDPKYRFDPFWSVGLGWNVYKEDFMKSIGWLDRLNVRATYGYNGNVDRSTSFMPLISAGGIPNTYTGDFTASVSSFGNPTLRWEKTGTWNLGLDYSVFRGRLFGKVDVYNKQGRDLIAQLSIPAANGTTSQKLNNAEMYNKGIELELGSALRLRGEAIKWRGSVNFSYNKNKITNLFVANYAASTLYAGGTGAYVEGENANSLWRFEYAGVVDKQPMVQGAEGALYNFGAFTPGDGRAYMRNVGTTVAPYTLGFINSFQVYDFNLSFILTGKFGHIFQRQGFNYPPTWTSRVLPNNKLSEVMNGDPSKIVPLPMNDIEPRYYFWDRFHQYLTYLIEDASHLRMQEVNLSYSLPNRLLSQVKLSRLQVYVQGNDLFTILANDAGEDPEYQLGSIKPQPKLTLGLKCEF